MRGSAILAAILAALFGASAAYGHASLIQSEPAERAVVAQPPPKLTLTFNEPVSPLALRLVRPNGEVIELKDVTANGAIIAVDLRPDLSRGTHVLSWRVMSADGHPVGGALTFAVGQRSATPTTLQPSDVGLRCAIWLARFILYLGLFVGIGGAFYGRWIATSPPRRTGAALIVVLGCGLVAALVSIALQGADVRGLPLSDVRVPRVWDSGLATPYGLTLCIAIVALALALAGVVSKRPIARWYSALALAGVGLALAASGHAATAGPEVVTRPAVFLHGVGVAFWVGALMPLAAALHSGSGRSELLRFSKAVPLPIAVLILSGLLLAIVQLQRPDALWTTNYGLILSAKLIAVGALFALALINRRLTPQVVEADAKSARRLVRSILLELAIVAVILGLVASWRFTPPPRALLAAASEPIRAHLHAERAMVDLQIAAPTAAGGTTTLSLLDGEFRPLSAKEVVVILTKPDAGIEPLRVPATHAEGDVWRIDRGQLPISGRWHVRVEILVSDFEKIAVDDEIDLR